MWLQDSMLGQTFLYLDKPDLPLPAVQEIPLYLQVGAS